MAVIVGIDEAGYGPLLGPLVVCGTVFVADDGCGCLWRRLRSSVTDRCSKRDRRLPILDSKKLHHAGDGLKTLERTALVMAAVADQKADTIEEFLRRIAPGAIDAMKGYPWYADFAGPCPIANDPADVGVRVAAVRRDLQDNGVRFQGVMAEPLLEGHFNRMVQRTRNKAVVSLGLVLRIIDRIVRHSAGERVLVYVDRQGGRLRYGDALMTAFADHEMRVVMEDPSRSAYELARDGLRTRVEFVVDGEKAHLPVALASIFAKYVRELLMTGFNRYWSQRVEALKPTAGYYQDALRFLKDIAPAVRREGLDRSLLVRCR